MVAEAWGLAVAVVRAVAALQVGAAAPAVREICGKRANQEQPQVAAREAAELAPAALAQVEAAAETVPAAVAGPVVVVPESAVAQVAGPVEDPAADLARAAEAAQVAGELGAAVVVGLAE